MFQFTICVFCFVLFSLEQTVTSSNQELRKMNIFTNALSTFSDIIYKRTIIITESKLHFIKICIYFKKAEYSL